MNAPDDKSPVVEGEFQDAAVRKFFQSLVDTFLNVIKLMGLGLILASVVLWGAERATHAGYMHIGPILHEIGMGLMVSSFLLFGFDFLFHVMEMKESGARLVRGYEALETSVRKIDSVSTIARTGLAAVVAAQDWQRTDSKLSIASAFDVVFSSVRDRDTISDYKVAFVLGNVNSDGYREITVKYSYKPIGVSGARELKIIRCDKNDDWTQRAKLDEASYETIWGFLAHSAEQGANNRHLPDKVFKNLKVSVWHGQRRTNLAEDNFSRVHHPEYIEYVTKEATVGFDLLEIEFTVLQSNEFSFVSDRIADLTHGYSATCTVAPGVEDIVGVWAGNLFSTSAPVYTKRDTTTVSVETSGWVIPSGGVTFSWASRDRTLHQRLTDLTRGKYLYYISAGENGKQLPNVVELSWKIEADGRTASADVVIGDDMGKKVLYHLSLRSMHKRFVVSIANTASPSEADGVIVFDEPSESVTGEFICRGVMRNQGWHLQNCIGPAVLMEKALIVAGPDMAREISQRWNRNGKIMTFLPRQEDGPTRSRRS